MTTYWAARQEARERLVEASWSRMTPDEMIACAIRRDRLHHRESQRAYAVRRGLSASFVARLESRPGDLRLAAVVEGLESTAYGLSVAPTGVRSCVASELIDLEAQIVGSAVRSGIEESEVSLRRFALSAGLPRTTLSRAVHQPGAVKLATIRHVLDVVGLVVGVARRDGGMVMEPRDWDVGEIAAQARGGRRRLAGHRLPLHTPDGPQWWWYGHNHGGRAGEVPQWTTLAPEHLRSIPSHRYAPRWIDSA